MNTSPSIMFPPPVSDALYELQFVRCFFVHNVSHARHQMYLDAHFLYQLPDCSSTLSHRTGSRLCPWKVDAPDAAKACRLSQKARLRPERYFPQRRRTVRDFHNAADVSQPQQQIGLSIRITSAPALQADSASDTDHPPPVTTTRRFASYDAPCASEVLHISMIHYMIIHIRPPYIKVSYELPGSSQLLYIIS